MKEASLEEAALKTKIEYEIDMAVAACAGLAAVRQGKSASQVVEDALRADPVVAEMLERHRSSPDLPDRDPKDNIRVPA